MKIWKHHVAPGMNVPAHAARILSFGHDPANDRPAVWFEADPDQPTREGVCIVPTGADAPDGRFVGTVTGIDGWLVFHAYAVPATSGDPPCEPS